MKYDLIVIGGGPGGYSAAASAAELGKSVCLFEAGELGGTCLNVGCIPTKYLLDRAAALEKLRAMTAEGILRDAGAYSFKGVQRGRAAAIEKLRNGVVGLLRSVGVIVVNGHAELLPERTVCCNGETYTAEDIIIATGSEPIMPKLPGIEYCIDSTAALSLSKVPKKLCVIGGGVIGLELGSAYLSYGSEVEIIEMAPSLLGSELKDAGVLLTRMLSDRGMKIQCDCKVLSIEKHDDRLRVNTSKGIIDADAVLAAVGRKPRLSGIDTERLGIETVNGAIKTDGYMQTTASHIYAVGDVIGGYMLAHAAYAEADTAISAIYGDRKPISYRVMPRIIYTLPSFAAVGITPEQANTAGIAFAVGASDYKGNGMAVAEGESGRVFALTDKNSKVTLGFCIVGAGAPEMIAAASTAVDKHYTIDDWKHLTVAHPTLSETLKSAALASAK